MRSPTRPAAWMRNCGRSSSPTRTCCCEAASALSVDSFERQCRDLSRHLIAARPGSDVDELAAQRARSCVKRWIDKTTGMHHTHLELDPVRDATLHAAIDAQIRRLRQVDGNARTPWAQLQVDAVIAATSGGPGAQRVPEISVLTDYDTLMSGWHAHSICETDDGVPLPVETVRRMCCDADILPIVLDGAGEVLDVGRARRTATPAQRRALRAMHRTCAHPDCTVGFSACDIHHIAWWGRDDGPTDIDNLLPVCERHHHLIHEDGWTLTMTPDRVATWTRPDGTIHATGTTIDRHPAERATRANLSPRVPDRRWQSADRASLRCRMTIDRAAADKLLTTTRSVRKRLDLTRPVEPELILECIEIAMQSPTGTNQQNWSFVVVTDADKRRTIADFYRRAGEMMTGSGLPAATARG